jgi:NAD(P)-dependent dehydrogenase (short-subunit alcohol dehydrogenase family)
MKNTILITGANNGFGFVAAERLAAAGNNIVMICRSRERGEAAQERIFTTTGHRPGLLLADLSLQSQVKRVAAEYRANYDRLDVLINNAGYAWLKRDLTAEGFERTFALNYLAYFTLTLELLDMLLASAPARIINTASASHRWQPISLENLQGEQKFANRFPPKPLMYGFSNAYRIMFTYELAERLVGTGVTANTFCPGFVPVQRASQSAFMNALVKLTSGMANARTPEEAAETIVYLASDPAAAALNGTYHASGVLTRSTEQTYDGALRRQLWDKTVQLANYTTDPLAQALAQLPEHQQL